MTPLLRAESLRLDVTEGDAVRRVLDDVSLELFEREFVLLRGPSGSGKTTLLSVLGGLLTPTRGDVVLEGRSIVRMRDHHRTALRRTRVGFVLQDLALIPGMTALDNVLLPFVPDGIGENERARALALLERFGLGTRALAKAARLSGGERQRVAVARALVRDPAVIFLDEPTAHVDATTARTLALELLRLRDEGRTLLVSTHDPRMLELEGVDRMLELDRGRLSAVPIRDQAKG